MFSARQDWRVHLIRYRPANIPSNGFLWYDGEIIVKWSSFFSIYLFVFQESDWRGVCFKGWSSWTQKGKWEIIIIKTYGLHFFWWFYLFKFCRRTNGWNSFWRMSKSLAKSWRELFERWPSRRTIALGMMGATKRIILTHCHRFRGSN